MSAKDLLFEIGTEEMPSAPLYKAALQLEVEARSALESANLGFKSIKVMHTPRRLVLMVDALDEQAQDVTAIHKGPAKSVGYTPEGEPTRAVEGFARGKGVSVDDLEIRTVDGVEYIYAVVEVSGAKSSEILPKLLSDLITSLDWQKSQRWGSGSVRFVRPVRWLLALYGGTVVPVTFGDLTASNITRGHRFLAPQSVEIKSMREYERVLEGNSVIVSQDKRRSMILTGIEELSKPYGEAHIDDAVLAEVVNLVEFPNGIVGSFDENFLEVPSEMLVSAMSKHQRYFPIRRTDGSLDNRFVVISNGDPSAQATIIAGHERVLRARLADADFFFLEDQKISLDKWSERLEGIVFQKKLGTIHDKVKRITRLVEYLARIFGVDEEVSNTAITAAQFSKFDLATSSVIEFTDLQGTMGSYFALAAGLDESVATAIREHYAPRFSGDAIPTTTAGYLVAMADKIDTIAGIFSIGQQPKATSDPFALRRAAIGILQIALHGISLDTNVLIAEALSAYDFAEADRERIAQEMQAFFKTRLASLMKAQGFAGDTVEAVLSVGGAVPTDAFARARALHDFRTANSEAMDDLSAAFKRAVRLADSSAGYDIDDALLTDPEVEFAVRLTETAQLSEEFFASGNYEAILDLFADLRGPIDTFFENVMVMDEDLAVRKNRLALLNVFVQLFLEFADFGKLA